MANNQLIILETQNDPVSFYFQNLTDTYYYTDDKTWNLSDERSHPFLIPLLAEITSIDSTLLVNVQFICVAMVNSHGNKGVLLPSDEENAIQMNYLYSVDPSADGVDENGLLLLFSYENSRIVYHKRTKGKVSNKLGGN